MSKGKYYSATEVAWLLDNQEKHDTYTDLYKDFINIFPFRSYRGFRTKCKEIGIRKINCQNYTQKEKKWVEENFHRFRFVKDLIAEFYKVFHKKVTRYGIGYMYRTHLGKKLFDQYAISEKEKQLPVGSEIKTGYGTIYVKQMLIPFDVKTQDKRYKYPYWVEKKRMIYESHYGEIPPDSFVIFLNGNHDDYNIENLYCVNRKIQALMAQNNWYTTDREHTLTAIKCCELMQALKR